MTGHSRSGGKKKKEKKKIKSVTPEWLNPVWGRILTLQGWQGYSEALSTLLQEFVVPQDRVNCSPACCPHCALHSHPRGTLVPFQSFSKIHNSRAAPALNPWLQRVPIAPILLAMAQPTLLVLLLVFFGEDSQFGTPHRACAHPH